MKTNGKPDENSCTESKYRCVQRFVICLICDQYYSKKKTTQKNRYDHYHHNYVCCLLVCCRMKRTNMEENGLLG